MNLNTCTVIKFPIRYACTVGYMHGRARDGCLDLGSYRLRLIRVVVDEDDEELETGLV